MSKIEPLGRVLGARAATKTPQKLTSNASEESRYPFNTENKLKERDTDLNLIRDPRLGIQYARYCRWTRQDDRSRQHGQAKLHALHAFRAQDLARYNSCRARPSQLGAQPSSSRIDLR